MSSVTKPNTNQAQDGGHVGDENTFACLKAAFDAGINFFDAAESYSGGESERVMGRAIKHFGWNRNDIVVSTKVMPPNRLSPFLLI
jgi:aryl-alcohol dehydrogenase-like predicted oxidoreductase